MDRTIESRRAKKPRPICPQCYKKGQSIDLKNVSESYMTEGKRRLRIVGKHCPNCDFIKKGI